MDDELLTLRQLSRRLRVPQSWLRSEAEAGRLPALRAGRRYLFSTSAVARTMLKRAADVPQEAHRG